MMPDDPAYILNIDDLKHTEADPSSNSNRGRRWLGIRFDCCDVYNRIYRNAAGTAYAGRCPKCYRRITIRVGPAGTVNRFFRAL